MRSLAEIRYRLRQEAVNLWLLASGMPSPGVTAPPPPPIRPAAHVPTEAVEELLAGRFRLFGQLVSVGSAVRWRQDPIHGQETPLAYFRRIPYLDFAAAGDHKNIWELSRHQHWVMLAEAFAQTGDRRCVEEIERQWHSWNEQNPWLRGINWTSALEVAFRAISWAAVDGFAGAALPADFRRRFASALYAHGMYLENNLSIYFSPNTHLLGEAVALHLLGSLYPLWPLSGRWKRRGAEIVDAHLAAKVGKDGSYFELSSYYQRYALDLFTLHYSIRGGALPEPVSRMAGFLADLEGVPPVPPRLGDDDGGQLYPAVARPSAVPAQSSRLHLPSGLAVLVDGPLRAIIDAGPFGPGAAGHSHADCLSLVLTYKGQELLVDPGTYTYVADPQWRDRFRGTAFHNTVRIGGDDQAAPDGPFRWRNPPSVAVAGWTVSEAEDTLTAECRYRGFLHRRTVRFQKPLCLVVTDEIHGPPGEHLLEQFWHCGRPAAARSPKSFVVGNALLLETSAAAHVGEGGEYGWVAPEFGSRVPAPVIVASGRFTLPHRFETVLSLTDEPGCGEATAIMQETK
ncbi:MAG: alginate lyase family protein [Bryobacteraceae bacterium]|nr:alginate lyase family protein [Bryobacteraceae bacterium]